jgi:hypothetical protein
MRPLNAQRFVERVLDDLEVTERAYHHLNFSLPLVADLVHRARQTTEAGARVLLVGGNTLLAEVLVRLGYRLDIWQFSQAYMTDAMKPLVTRRVSAETLDSLEPTDERYELIIAPLVVEALSGPLDAFLRRLRYALSSDGRVLIATSNQARLDSRIAAMTGRPMTPKAEATAVSLSWPAIPTVHELHVSELRSAGQSAGFHTRECDHVVSERAFLEMEPLNAFDYARRKLRGAVMQSLPRSRDVLVAELAPRVGEGIPLKTRSDDPFVSVFVSVYSGGDRLRETVDSLLAQTYPGHLIEIVVLHDGSSPEVDRIVADTSKNDLCTVRQQLLPHADGPGARNQAMAESRSDIAAHTNDYCYLPEDWLQAAVAWFDADTVAVTGPVFLRSGSEGRFVSVPATRPDPDEKGVSPQGLFPISNVFYRTPIAVAAGGFDRAFSRPDGDSALGWDTEFACRLSRSGWRTRFREEVYQFRTFPADDNRRGWISSHLRRAEEVPMLMATAPEYAQSTLAAGVFASKQTMYFDMALAGLLLAAKQRRWPWLLTALPWLAMASHHVDVWPPERWPHSVRSFGRLVARQTVWLAGFVKGSAKAKRIVL